MPNYHFRCPEGHEFDKLVNIKGGIYKWCKYCDKLTQRIEVSDPNEARYHQKVCIECLGNEHCAPVLASKSDAPKIPLKEPCPICGQLAEHVLAYKEYSRPGGSTVADSSLRFHFNYSERSE